MTKTSDDTMYDGLPSTVSDPREIMDNLLTHFSSYINSLYKEYPDNTFSQVNLNLWRPYMFLSFYYSVVS